MVALMLTVVPYVRTHTDPATAEPVKVGPASKLPHCLWWTPGTITYRQGGVGNPETTGDTEFSSVNASFQSWQDASDACGNLTFHEGPHTTERKVGHDPQSSSNENVVLFRTTNCRDLVGPSAGCWADDTCMNQYDCWAYASNTIALTTTTFDPRDGQIYGADIELNAKTFHFTTANGAPCPGTLNLQSCVVTDIQNTVTHEIGHALGLDHSGDPASTMYASAPEGETSKRTLDSGSKKFICDAYPKGSASRDCVIVPVQANVGPALTLRGCASAGNDLVWSAALPLALALTWRRRKARSA